VIDIDATILNSDVYKQIVSSLNKTKSNRLIFINAIITKMSKLDDIYIQSTFKVEKQKFLDSLNKLLLYDEARRQLVLKIIDKKF
jgi:hypothetical protein